MQDTELFGSSLGLSQVAFFPMIPDYPASEQIKYFQHVWEQLGYHKGESSKERFRLVIEEYNNTMTEETSWNLSDSQAEAGEQRNDEIQVESLWKAQQDRHQSGAHL